MKYLFSLLLLFVSLSVFAQEPPYTPMRLNYQFRGIRVDSLFLIPNYVDTSAANGSLSKRIAGSFVRTGNDFWMRNSDTSAWLQNVNVGSGASPTLNFVNNVFKKSGTDSVFYVVAPADTFFSFKDLGVDTTSLSNRIDLKVDSIKRSSDSVYFKRSGVWSFGYKDSLGQSLNFANADLRATGNRTHSFADNSLYIDSIQNLTLKSNAIGQYGIIANSAGEPYLLSLDQVDFSMSNVLMTKDSAFYGGTKSGSYFGLRTNSDANNISLIRGPNKAFLSRRDFGIDTIALKSDITGGQNFANANLTATGSRTHNFKNYDLLIDSIGYYDVQTYSPSPGAHRSYTTMSESGVGLYMTNTTGKQSGFFAASPFNQVYIRRDDNNAWISKKNFGQDTLAFVSQIKGDSPDRINGTATGNVTARIPVSSLTFNGNYFGGRSGNFYLDSLNSIDFISNDFGLKTNDFDIQGDFANTSTFNIKDFDKIEINQTDHIDFSIDSSIAIIGRDTRISGIDSMKIINSFVKLILSNNKINFKTQVTEKKFLEIDTLGNFQSGDLTGDSLTFKIIKSSENINIKTKNPNEWINATTGLASQIKTGYAKSNIDLSAGAYEIKLPGVYTIIDASTNSLTLPDPQKWGGQSITIINRDGANVITFAGGNDPYLYDGSQVNTQWLLSIMTIYSDGQTWTGIYNK